MTTLWRRAQMLLRSCWAIVGWMSAASLTWLKRASRLNQCSKNENNMLKRAQGWMIILFRVVTTMNNLQVATAVITYNPPHWWMEEEDFFVLFLSLLRKMRLLSEDYKHYVKLPREPKQFEDIYSPKSSLPCSPYVDVKVWLRLYSLHFQSFLQFLCFRDGNTGTQTTLSGSEIHTAIRIPGEMSVGHVHIHHWLLLAVVTHMYASCWMQLYSETFHLAKSSVSRHVST